LSQVSFGFVLFFISAFLAKMSESLWIVFFNIGLFSKAKRQSALRPKGFGGFGQEMEFWD
jgi:hypothetical protein